MAADRRSGKGTGKRGRAAGTKTISKKTIVKTPKRAAAAAKARATPGKTKPGKKISATKKAAAKGVASKPAARATAKARATRDAKIARAAKKINATSRRSAAARIKISLLPPLPLPLAVAPKKLSRSLVRRAVGTTTLAQKGVAGAPELVSEEDLREKMRLASGYIDTWLNRRLLFAAEVTSPEDAWADLWHWLKRAAQLDDGRVLTLDLFEALYADEVARGR